MGPDPGPWILLNPQSYNAYTYGSNNPLRYSDDSGMTPQDRVNAANSFASENIAYLLGGKNPSCGLDCSGLVQNVFMADPDNTITRLDNILSAAGQAQLLQNQGYFSTEISDARPGDAIFFADPRTGRVVHTGIVIDIRDGKVYFVHAPRPGKRVGRAYVDMKTLYFGAERFAGIGRPIESSPLSPSAAQNQSQGSSGFWNTLDNAFNNLLGVLGWNQSPQGPSATVCTANGPGSQICWKE